MNNTPDILCIGSVLWDVIGRSASHMRIGSDVPGRITRLPGGVAMNIAMTLRRFGLTPALLTTIGKDEEGRELLADCQSMGMNCDYVYLSEDLPTDRYMAIEGANGLIAAIADAHSLEAAGDKILRPLENGRLGSAKSPYTGMIALDGNLTLALLETISKSPFLPPPTYALHLHPPARPSDWRHYFPIRMPRFTSIWKRQAFCARPPLKARNRPRAPCWSVGHMVFL